MPRADRLGDPLEGTTPQGELDAWERRAAEATTDAQRKIIRENRAKLSGFARGFRDLYFVSCWHMNNQENYGMWDCYTSKPDSVAIHTSYANLTSYLPGFTYAGMVRYLDYAADALPSMNMFEYIMHKNVGYRFENEVRAVAMAPFECAPDRDEFYKHLFQSETDAAFHVYAPPIAPARLIEGVVLHPEASEEFAEEMGKLCEAKGIPRPQRSGKSRSPVY